MHLSTRVLGKHVADQITARAAAPLLVIGRDKFFRRDLAAIDCYNFLAALRLSSVIATLGPRDTKDLFDNYPPTALVVPQIGSISLAVLGAAFEKKGIGGSQPLEGWFNKHRPKEYVGREFVTFSHMKHVEHLREVGEKRARKQRKEKTAARRDKAQRIRGDRFIERQEGTVKNGSVQ